MRSPKELLVAKLTTLLSRTVLRDLQDVRALLDAGGELRRALADAPRRDGGFSPLTLAWVLRSWEPGRIAAAAGLGELERSELLAFHQELIDQLLSAAAPP